MVLMVDQILLESMHEKIVCACVLLHLGRRTRIRGKIRICLTRILQGLLLSNLVYEVVNICPTTYLNLVEIAPIVF